VYIFYTSPQTSVNVSTLEKKKTHSLSTLIERSENEKKPKKHAYANYSKSSPIYNNFHY